MKAIKLWEIISDGSGVFNASQIDNVEKTETEEQLEEVLTRCPDLLMEDLKLVGRQTDTPGGPLDLLGVDSDGRLVIFELKRGVLTREAVAQIIDYCSYLAELEPEKLSIHISERSGNLGIDKIDNFMTWYQEHFGKGYEEVTKPKMVLVGLGADERTKRMVAFLADSDVDISLITFHGFKKDEKTLLARQVEVQAKGPIITTAYTKKANLEKLKEKVRKLNIDEYYYEMAAFFRDKLPAYEWPNPGGYSYSLPEPLETGSESNRVYLALYINDNQPRRTKICLYPRAIEASKDAFSVFQNECDIQVDLKNDGGAEIWIGSLMEWEGLKPSFEKYCPELINGWKKKREKQSSQEFSANDEEVNRLGE
jgi:endonuclease NucS-like protein